MIRGTIVTYFIKVGIWIRKILRLTYDRHPSSRVIIDRLWNSLEILMFVASVWYNHRTHSDEAAELQPRMLIEVDPRIIEYHSGSGVHFIMGAGRVKSGIWDETPGTAIKDKLRWESFEKHFINGKEWRETKFYRHKVKKIKSDKVAKYETELALNRKCKELDLLFNALQEEGYKTQEELVASGDTGQTGDGGRGFFWNSSRNMVRHEICVDIGRDGQIFLNEGRHRVNIAKLLEMDLIPVRVVVRHRKWQNLRNEICRYISKNKNSEDMKMDELKTIIANHQSGVKNGIQHPDIQALVCRGLCR